MTNNKKNILITGASGFLGSVFIKRYQRDYNIFTLARGDQNDFSDQVHYIQADLTKEFLTLLPSNIDVVMHLANSDSYKNFPDGFMNVFDVNIRSTAMLLDWSQKNGIKNFIFASTGNVYKRHSELVNETYPCEPESSYAASKYAAEILCYPYAQEMTVNILRIFGLYGQQQKKGMMHALFEGVDKGQEFVFHGGKGLVITPTYIGDAISAIKLIVDAESQSRGCEIYNLSGDEIVDLPQLTSDIGAILNKKINYNVSEALETNLLGCNKKLKDTFLWKPVTKLSQGLINMNRGRA